MQGTQQGKVLRTRRSDSMQKSRFSAHSEAATPGSESTSGRDRDPAHGGLSNVRCCQSRPAASDPLLPAAVFSPSDRSTLELDVRWRRREKPRWRQQSFAEAVRRSRQFRRRTAASDGHEQALPTLNGHSLLLSHRPEAAGRTRKKALVGGPALKRTHW